MMCGYLTFVKQDNEKKTAALKETDPNEVFLKFYILFQL